jgi:hypothetical protein
VNSQVPGGTALGHLVSAVCSTLPTLLRGGDIPPVERPPKLRQSGLSVRLMEHATRCAAPGLVAARARVQRVNLQLPGSRQACCKGLLPPSRLRPPVGAASRSLVAVGYGEMLLHNKCTQVTVGRPAADATLHSAGGPPSVFGGGGVASKCPALHWWQLG